MKTKINLRVTSLITVMFFSPLLWRGAGGEAFAQNLGINATGATPNPSTILDLNTGNTFTSPNGKGLLIPNVALVSNTDAVTIASPATSILVYNPGTGGLTPAGYWYNSGTSLAPVWLQLGGGGGGSAWSLFGNAGTVDGTNFIGTTDNVPFNIRVNNQKAGRIDHLLFNSFFGYQAGNASTGTYNTASGYQALALNSTGTQNTASGAFALNKNTTGIYNTASGSQALYSNTTGSNNTALGMVALYSNSTGTQNTASGQYALYNNTASQNTASGAQALALCTTGSQNTASGAYSLYTTFSGIQNTASGYQALYSNTGSNNTAFGMSAGSAITTGLNNTAIGMNAQVPAATANNQVRIGDPNITYAGIQVAWTITSDKRWKADIEPSNLGLDFISKLKPVSYIRNNNESPSTSIKVNSKREYGFIAQDLEETLNGAGASDNGIISKDDKGMYGVRYNDLMAPMVKAIQELNNSLKSKNEELKAEIETLKSANNKQQSEIEKIQQYLKLKAER